jgi:dCMP deaminase
MKPNKNNPHNKKYFEFYMQLAIQASEQSLDNKLKVGAAIVLPSGLIALGWNGTPPGFDNECNYPSGKSKPHVIHAERNALDKLTREGTSPQGAMLFVTTAPCLECSKSIAAVGVVSVIYGAHYKSFDGIEFLVRSNVEVHRYSEIITIAGE